MKQLIKSLVSIMIFFSAATTWANCDLILDEMAGLNPAQQKLVEKIQEAWETKVWNPNISTHSFYHYSHLDSEVIKIYERLGFEVSHEKRQLTPPKSPWVFLAKAQEFMKNKNNKMVPGLVLQKIEGDQFIFITKPSDLPIDAKNWSAENSRLLLNNEYYSAIEKGILPISLGGFFSNHEFEHLISLYHPDSFPNYYYQIKRMAGLALGNKITEQQAFLFSEVFSFVRIQGQEPLQLFSHFLRTWNINPLSYENIQKTINSFTSEQLRRLNFEFLEMFPQITLDRGGFIRDTTNTPHRHDALNFLEDWKKERFNKSHYIDSFRHQNWRTYYINLALIYLLPTNTKTIKEYKNILAYSGLDFYTLENYKRDYPQLIKPFEAEYLKIGLAELIWALHLSFDLKLSSADVIEAFLSPHHPNHEKVKRYFQEATTATYSTEEKINGIHYQVISEKIPESLPNRLGGWLKGLFTGHW